MDHRLEQSFLTSNKHQTFYLDPLIHFHNPLRKHKDPAGLEDDCRSRLGGEGRLDGLFERVAELEGQR